MVGKHVCINRALDNTKYAYPVPIIGMYIAGGTVVCLLLMVLDIFAAYRRRKPWIPVNYFALNSLSLTLLSIAAKLPLDLTSSMPRGIDQLSKLTGTTFMCISMGFMLPSIGKNKAPETKSNMYALTIVVVTIAVNICMQAYTGVIFSFVIEHIIILSYMLVLLSFLWSLTFHSEVYKGGYLLDRNKELLLKGKRSFLARLELCYVHGYKTNPQFFLSHYDVSQVVGAGCVSCSVILIQAAIRTFLMWSKYCEDNDSDYKWSLWGVACSQILFVVVGGISISFRWFSCAGHYIWGHGGFDKVDLTIRSSTFLSLSLQEKCVYLIENITMLMFFVVGFICIVPASLHSIIGKLVQDCWRYFDQPKYVSSETVKRFKKLFDFPLATATENEMWSLKKGIIDLEMSIDESKKDPLKDMMILFSETLPTEVCPAIDLKDHWLLPLILLIRMAKGSVSNTLAETLFHALREAHEIVCFIDATLSSKTSASRTKARFGKAAWEYMKNEDFKANMSKGSLHDVVAILCKDLHVGFLKEDLGVLKDIIENTERESSEELPTIIKQLFVDMLQEVLRELPNAIFNYVTESPIEEYEDRVRRTMKFVCKLSSLANHVKWKFPRNSGMVRLVNRKASHRRSQNTSIVEVDKVPAVHNNVLTAVEDEVV